MAKRKPRTALKQASIYVNEIDDAIEKETYSNADTIMENLDKSDYLKNAHSKILEVLDIKSGNDSKYFDFDVYVAMVTEKVELRKERKKKAEEKKQDKKEMAVQVQENDFHLGLE